MRSSPGLDRWLVFLLPLVPLALAPHLLFGAPSRDPWIYYGYYENLVFYLRRFADAYYTSRLAAVVPGFVLHHLFPPVLANVLLHLGLVWAALLSFHAVARDLFGRRAALLASVAAAGHPFLLRSLGWDYVDGYGIAYFLIGMALATRASRGGRGWWLWLAGAGATSMALVSTNVFYGLYVPLIGGHFLLLDRRRRRLPVPASLAAGGAGAAGFYVALGALSWMARGPFHYLRSSFAFVSDVFLSTENPFRDPTYAWVPKAVWLAVPVLVLAGGAIVLRGVRGAWREQWRLVWVHLQLVYVFLVLGYVQIFGDGAVLQHSYYASLLIPPTFLALAGQVRWLLPQEDGRRLHPWLALALLAVLAVYAVPFAPGLSRGSVVPAPLLWTLLVGAGMLVALTTARRTPGALALFFTALALAHLAIWQSAGAFRAFEAYGNDGAGLFRQMSETVRALEEIDPGQAVRLWYDVESEHGEVYDAVASAFLLCPRMVGLAFAVLESRRMCDGEHLRPGTRIAVLSNRADAFEEAAAALRGVRLGARLVARYRIAGPIPDYAVTYLAVEELADGAQGEVAVGDPQHVGQQAALDLGES